MTLKEYLESYDEPLNEGFEDKIKDWFIKLKRNMGKILLGTGIIASLSGMTASNFSDNYRDWDGYSSNQEKVLLNKFDTFSANGIIKER